MERHTHLTEEQQAILDLAEKGHNICILGKAGVGKSTIVKEIWRTLSAKGLKCEIVCSTGIACKNYSGMAKTAHSFYGLQIAELPSDLVIQRSLKQDIIKKQLRETSVLIWDEVSMISKRIFELVNMLHHLVSENNFAFGGIQVILAGDFWQLKPVPSVFDVGKSIYESRIFNDVFQHRIELTKILRQSESEDVFKDLLEMLRVGKCNDEAEEYARSLSREIAAPEGNESIHIYFKKVYVEFHNGTVLANLPGDLIQFKSIDTGNTSGLEKSISGVLSLKPMCKVMLLYNINDNLKNGYQGEFVGVDPCDDGQVIVNFSTTGLVRLGRRSWIKYAPNGEVQGSRTQFPIHPCYAITVHKSQSLTLNSVVLHCAQEFVSGQTYVAMSRVKSSSNIQVINFHRRFLLPPPPELVNLACECLEPTESYSCCRHQPLDESYFVAEDSVTIDHEEPPYEWDTESEEDDVHGEEGFFETTRGTASSELDDVLLCLVLNIKTELSTPPSTFTMTTFLASVITSRTDPYSESINEAARYAMVHLETFEILANILWCRIAALFERQLTDNLENIHMTNKDFTLATTQIHELFLSDDYRKDLQVAFGVRRWKKITDGQRTLCVQLVFQLYEILIVEIEKRIKKEEAEPIEFNVAEMDGAGLGKVRYVGAWAFRKCLEKCRRYVMSNKNSEAQTTREKVRSEIQMLDLLENNVIVPYQVIEKTTAYPQSVRVTESRQYRERGLLHISDNAYEFFLLLEQKRVDLINLHMLSLLKADMVNESIKGVRKNETLKSKFLSLFDIESEGEKVITK